MKNIKELVDELSVLFGDIKCGEVDVNVAKQMNNTAGKMINALKVQILYAEQKKVAPSINFLDVPENK